MRTFLLILLNSWSLMVAVRARLPYIRSSGYYRPFPPNNNQIMYEFAPLSSNNKHGGLQQHLHDQQDSTKTRATRDLEWREFDAFISGTDEPSCADLRRMWRLAKQLQQKALESNEISQQMHHNPFTASFKAENQKSSSPKSSSQSHHQCKFQWKILATATTVDNLLPRFRIRMFWIFSY